MSDADVLVVQALRVGVKATELLVQELRSMQVETIEDVDFSSN
jgi:hypothetical protein